jgi:tetratricopeptide (TPR) repeat protein
MVGAQEKAFRSTVSKGKRVRRIRNRQRAKAGRDAYTAGRDLTIVHNHADTVSIPFQSGAMPVVLAQLPPAAAGFTGRDNQLRALQEGRSNSTALVSVGYVAGLPASPDLEGRDAELAALVEAWLATTPPQPVAVLGAPGIGKSAICMAALHDHRVVKRFGNRRWFIRCDGAASAEALLSALAAELGVIGDGAQGPLLDRVCSVLGAGLAVLVLDNFETPWIADPLPTEELLRSLSAIQGTAVAVSLRGTVRPAGLRWSDFAVLNPLRLTDARRMFLAVAGTTFAGDPQLDELLGELDGVPLAVELMGYAAQGQPALEEVAARWQAERTGMLQRMGGACRELSVAVSVETSITSPLMTAPARRLLGLLGVLPDGLTRDGLAALLPGIGLAGAAGLRQLGLAFDEGARLRMLTPIRDHTTAEHPPDPEDLDRAMGYYAELAAAYGDQTGRREGAQAVTLMQAEIGNITAMAERAAATHRIDKLTDALWGLIEYWLYTGTTQPALVQTAQQAISAHGTPFQQAHIWSALGNMAIARGDHDGARRWYERAVPLYQQIDDVSLAADCIQRLGDVALERSDLEEAQARYGRALKLYRQAGSVHGAANCIQRLGDVALKRSDLKRARIRYEQALKLYQQAGYVHGEANCITRLGDIALERSDPEDARVKYEQALELYQATHHPFSVGWTLVRLARLDPPGNERTRRWRTARSVWASIRRDDLVESVKTEFE